MPEMDGLTATRQDRAEEGEGRDRDRRADRRLRRRIPGGLPGSRDGCRHHQAGHPGPAAGGDRRRTRPRRASPAPGGPNRSTSRLRELGEMLGEDAVAEIVCTFAEDTQANLDDDEAGRARMRQRGDLSPRARCRRRRPQCRCRRVGGARRRRWRRPRVDERGADRDGDRGHASRSGCGTEPVGVASGHVRALVLSAGSPRGLRQPSAG